MGEHYRCVTFRLYQGRKGVGIMTAFEIIMIILTFAEILIAVITMLLKK